MEKILDLIADFGDEYRSRLDQAMTDELKDSVNSVVKNRHQIAHGHDVGISLPTLRNYYRNVVKVVETIEMVLDEA